MESSAGCKVSISRWSPTLTLKLWIQRALNFFNMTSSHTLHSLLPVSSLWQHAFRVGRANELDYFTKSAHPPQSPAPVSRPSHLQRADKHEPGEGM